jgi:uncharacterized protein YbbC (DUF1343 family)
MRTGHLKLHRQTALRQRVRSCARVRDRARVLCVILCVLCAACAQPVRTADTPPTGERAAGAPRVLTGLDVLLRDGAAPLVGRRVGLITNHTGLDARGRSGIDALHAHAGVRLVALFSPEHGLTGRADAGERVVDGQDPRTGLPIYSLYGGTRQPTEAMLSDIDVLVFDIQDIGTRYYTYVWTMALALQSAAQYDTDFIVLDRPNPIGGALVHGNVLDPEFSTFVGLYPVPMRHGMTAGEIARFVNEEHAIGARLTVIPLEGWRRTMWYDETGLPWTPPSPNMPSVESAAHYPGTCLFEGTNLSVGRGTSEAFRHIGAPWLDAAGVVQRLERYALPGVRFEATSFTPRAPADRKFADRTIPAIRLTVTDRAVYDPARAGIALLVEIQALHAPELTFAERHFDRLAGTDRVRTQLLAGESYERITAGWNAELARFNAVRARHLLYP